jgi:hypothetical protein
MKLGSWVRQMAPLPRMDPSLLTVVDSAAVPAVATTLADAPDSGASEKSIEAMTIYWYSGFVSGNEAAQFCGADCDPPLQIWMKTVFIFLTCAYGCARIEYPDPSVL